MRALEELRLADDTITVEDLHTFAGTLIKEMDLMIGSEKFLRGRFDVIDQIDLFYPNVHHQIADQLHWKIIVAQQNLAKQNLAKLDDEVPF